jgi:hypothetical protein
LALSDRFDCQGLSACSHGQAKTTKFGNKKSSKSFVISFENLAGVEDFCHEIGVSYVNITRLVVPAWTAGTQVDMDTSGRILRAWIPDPCRHDGSC